MGIKVPGYHLRSPRDLKELRYRLKGGGKSRSIHEELTLTSMIDMFAVIIIFLIQTFSTTGDIMFINKDIELPKAMYAKEIRRAPIITVTPEKVSLEGAAVGSNDGIDSLVEETDWALPLLTQKMSEYKRFFEETHDGVKFPAEVIIQSDHEIDFLYIKRVLFTLTKIGYTNINLAVRGTPTGSQELPGESVDEGSTL